MKNRKKLVRDGDVWRQAAIRLARAIIRFQRDDFRANHTDSTIVFAYRVSKGRLPGS
jgi:transposase